MSSESYKSLVSRVATRARLCDDVYESLSVTLTLGGKLEPESALSALSYPEVSVFKNLRAITAFRDHTETVPLHAYHRHNRLFVTDSKLEENDLCIFIRSFNYPIEQWKQYKAHAERNRKNETATCREILQSSLTLAHKRVDRIEYYLKHMAPVIYYAGQETYSNFDYLNNLTASKTSMDRNSLFDYWQHSAVDQWTDDDCVFVCFVDYLLSSGSQTRCEEFNAKQISLKNLNLFCDRKAHEYSSRGVLSSGYRTNLPLGAKVESINDGFQKLIARNLVYRNINGLSLQKNECYFDENYSTGSLFSPPKIKEILWSEFKLETDDVSSYRQSLTSYYTRKISSVGYNCAFRNLMNKLLLTINDETHSDVALTRFFGNIGLLISLTREKQYQKIVDLNPRNFYSYAVPGSAMLKQIPDTLTTNILMAVTTRMLYNGWHYMPANFIHDKGVDLSARDYYFSASMPDIANMDQYHHLGHTQSNVNATIRIPGSLLIENREYKSITDLRLMRRQNKPYATQDLQQAINMFELIRLAQQTLIDIIAENADLALSLEQMSKSQYAQTIQDLRRYVKER